jgi:hypothetical protein
MVLKHDYADDDITSLKVCSNNFNNVKHYYSQHSSALHPLFLKGDLPRNSAQFPFEKGGEGMGSWREGIRGKIFGIPDNFSQGIPDDPANLCPVSPDPSTFELIL